MRKKQSPHITATKDPEKAKRTRDAIEFLPVPYTATELLDMGERLARAQQERETAEDQFEVLKTNHKHVIEGLEASIRSLYRKITQRSHWENVDCVWMLETPTPHEKQLIRKDTGEIVKTLPMEKNDFQIPLIPAALKPEVPMKAGEAEINGGKFSLDQVAEKVVEEVNSGALDTANVKVTAALEASPLETPVGKQMKGRRRPKLQGQDALLGTDKRTEFPHGHNATESEA